MFVFFVLLFVFVDYILFVSVDFNVCICLFCYLYLLTPAFIFVDSRVCIFLRRCLYLLISMFVLILGASVFVLVGLNVWNYCLQSLNAVSFTVFIC